MRFFLLPFLILFFVLGISAALFYTFDICEFEPNTPTCHLLED
jgi:hypothetical protein